LRDFGVGNVSKIKYGSSLTIGGGITRIKNVLDTKSPFYLIAIKFWILIFRKKKGLYT